jgi:hypothetical protein
MRCLIRLFLLLLGSLYGTLYEQSKLIGSEPSMLGILLNWLKVSAVLISVQFAGSVYLRSDLDVSASTVLVPVCQNESC